MVTFKNHPFRFLLQFEWCLLALCAVGEVVQVPPFRSMRGIPHAPLWNLTIVFVFFLLSLQLPERNRFQRWSYGALLLGLLAIAAFGTGLKLLVLLCIVVVLRCGVLFESSISWVIAGLTFLMGAGAQVYYLMTFRLPRLEQMAMRRAARLGISPEDINTEGMDPVTSRLWTSSLSSILLLGLVLLFVQVLIASLVSERRNREALAIANTRLRDYALKAEATATLQERNRISREIHDALGHSLTASNIHLEAALRLLKSDPEEATELLHEAKRLGSETLQAVRDSVSALRSEDPLKSQPLDKAIELLLQDWSRSSQIVPSFDLSADLSNLPESLKVAIYRIIQEALTNISKYARASHVRIQLTTSNPVNPANPKNPDLLLVIADDGVGFIRSQTRSGFGLQGIEERAQALDGTFEVRTAIGQGCKIWVTLPIPIQTTIQPDFDSAQSST
jgi:signal transduction histidine kinase